jgi:hypothetical protein
MTKSAGGVSNVGTKLGAVRRARHLADLSRFERDEPAA